MFQRAPIVQLVPGTPMRLICAVLCSYFLVVSVSANEDKPAKPASRTARQISGWTVKVDDRLLSGDDSQLGVRALKILENRLDEIGLVVPADKLTRLQQVPIFLDRTHGELKSAQYHPGADWLTNHGYSEELAKSVHIPDAAIFFSPRHLHDQPWAVMHELAHAYHDQVLSFEHPEIKAAWQQFKDSGRYELVRHIGGTQRKHYAVTNQMEFFAEMSESYFGMNDFFPFNRAELQHEEPAVFQLLQDIWGPLP